MQWNSKNEEGEAGAGDADEARAIAWLFKFVERKGSPSNRC